MMKSTFKTHKRDKNKKTRAVRLFFPVDAIMIATRKSLDCLQACVILDCRLGGTRQAPEPSRITKLLEITLMVVKPRVYLSTIQLRTTNGTGTTKQGATFLGPAQPQNGVEFQVRGSHQDFSLENVGRANGRSRYGACSTYWRGQVSQ